MDVSAVLGCAGLVAAAYVAWTLYTLIIVPWQQYRFLRKQGIPGEPFVPLLGQLSEFPSELPESHLLTFASPLYAGKYASCGFSRH